MRLGGGACRSPSSRRFAPEPETPLRTPSTTVAIIESMTELAPPASADEPVIDKDIVAWSDLDDLVLVLAGRLADRPFDVMLAITRGGLVPAGMLAYRLRLRNILVAAVEYYDDHGLPGPHPTFLQFPADPLLRGQRVLIVDEVWDSGTTIAAVTERVRQAGGIPTTAVLHYKPARSTVPGRPDVYAVETDRWVVYPFKAGG